MTDVSHGEGLGTRVEELERQVARLTELAARAGRQNRLLKGACALSLPLAAALLAVGWIPGLAEKLGVSAEAPMLVPTEKGVGSAEYSLRNTKGAQMSVLECDKFGAPNLVMTDLAQRYRVGLKVWEDGRADLNFYDAGGRLRGRFGVSAGGDAGLVLSADEGQERARVSVSADGSPTIRLTDARGKVVFQAP